METHMVKETEYYCSPAGSNKSEPLTLPTEMQALPIQISAMIEFYGESRVGIMKKIKLKCFSK